jgi:hypothetical protein
VTIYIASARNQITANSKVVPAVLATINPLLAQLGSEHTNTYLASIAGNTTALRTALECRGCLSSPFAAEQVDLLPFDVPEAAGSTMVGLIFVSSAISFLLRQRRLLTLTTAPHVHLFDIPNSTSER